MQRGPSSYYRGRKISFQYQTHFITDINKEFLKHDGKRYEVSPCHLIMNDGDYYLIARQDEDRELRTFLIDRIKNIKILEESSRGSAYYIPHVKTYIRRTFSMFGGKPTNVEMRFHNSLLDAVIDKFGVGFGADYHPDGENHFVINMEVEVSDKLETLYEGLYIIGDGSGITHSLSHASASGVYVARDIIKKL